MKSPQQGSGWRRTFELRDLPGRAFWQPFVASVTRQGHGDSTASEQEPNLLASCVLGKRQGHKSQSQQGRLRSWQNAASPLGSGTEGTSLNDQQCGGRTGVCASRVASLAVPAATGP